VGVDWFGKHAKRLVNDRVTLTVNEQLPISRGLQLFGGQQLDVGVRAGGHHRAIWFENVGNRLIRLEIFRMCRGQCGSALPDEQPTELIGA